MAGTIQQIADMAGVSRGTVDRALNHRGRVNPEVAKRILEIADSLNYVQKHKSKKKYRIGVITQLSKAAFMRPVQKGIEDAQRILRYRGVELILEDCASVDEEEQLKAIDRLVEKKADGIALMPVESNRIREKINKLTETLHIPVVTFNSDIVGTKRSCFVGLDNRRSGQAAAGLMGMLTGGTGKIFVITGYFGNSVSNMRVDGFVEELKQSFPGLELIGVQSSFDDAAEMEKLVANALGTYPDLAGIFVVSGGQAGIRHAFAGMRLKKKPHVVVYDLTEENVQALEDGIADFLIDQNGYMQGYRALLILTDILKKEKYPSDEFFYTDIVIKTKYNI